MSYENAPATRLLATHCAACSRPLVDSVSVEAGIGPDCRKKHGFAARIAQLSEEDRAAANKLVHMIALNQAGDDVLAAVVSLRFLGFGVLADRILDRLDAIRVEHDEAGRLLVAFPFSEDAVATFKAAVPASRRSWDKKLKRWILPRTASTRLAVVRALSAAFPGRTLVGPGGSMTLAA